jgi:hypothetical protein
MSKPKPKTASNCDFPAYPAGVHAPKLTDPAVPPLNAALKGGYVTGPTLSVPAGVNVTLTSSLTLVAAGDIVVDGTISLTQLAQGAAAIDIILVSLEKDVIVNAGTAVGTGTGAPGADAAVTGARATAQGKAGGYGGVVKLISKKGNIKIMGSVLGDDGGSGGSATATGTLAGGGAIAVGAQGGPRRRRGALRLRIDRHQRNGSVGQRRSRAKGRRHSGQRPRCAG